MQSLSDTIRKVCEFPQTLRDSQSSAADIYILTRYSKFASQITHEALRAYLEGHSALPAMWQEYSENKRSTSSWALTKSAGNLWEVTYMEQFGPGRSFVFQDQLDACAGSSVVKWKNSVISRLLAREHRITSG